MKHWTQIASWLIVIQVLLWPTSGWCGGKADQENKGKTGTIRIRRTFSAKKLTLSKFNGFDTVMLHGAVMPEDEPGTPWLPATYINILLPAGATVTSVKATPVRERVIARGLNMLPTQPPVPTNGSMPKFVTPKAVAYQKKSRKALHQHSRTQKMRGMSFVPVRLNPVRLVPVSGTLHLAEEIEVTVTFSKATEKRTISKRHFGIFKKAVSRIVVNPDEAEAEPSAAATPDTKQTSVAAGSVGTPTGICDYLIITDGTLAAAFGALASHRSSHNGYTTEVVTTATIYANYPGTDNQDRIRNCIIDYVNTKGTLCVALGGDNTIVPDRNCYVSCGGYTESNMPTDLYYAGLDGNWDEDGDGVYGEANTAVGDEGDLAADVFVGRIPVRTVAQTSAYINKIVAYETTPPLSIVKKFMMSGKYLWDSYTNTDRPSDLMNDGHLQFEDASHTRVSDAEMWMRRAFRDRVQVCGWNPTEIGTMFDTLTSWDSATAGDYAAGPTNMVTRFSEGWNFVISNTHGGTTVLTADGGSFNTSHAGSLTGPTHFFYTGACLSGAFDSAEPSVSEAMLRNPNGGALVYLGCSRYGWGSPDVAPASNSSTGGTSSRYMREFLQLVFEDGITNVGQAFFDHKAACASFSGSDNSYRWIQFGLNLQGDPGLTMIVSDGTNNAPIVHSQSVTTANHLSPSIVLTASDFEKDPLTFSIVGTPSNGVLTGTPPNVTYTPNAGFIGTDSFSFKANDGASDSNLATVTLTVTANNAPQTWNATRYTPMNTAVPFDLSGCAHDNDGDSLTFNVVTGPSHGVLSGTMPNLTYTPDAGHIGTDSFTFKANDSIDDSNVSTFTLNVGNYPPRAWNSFYRTDEDTPVSVTLSGYDQDGGPLTFTVLSNPSNGVLSGTAPDLTYTPNADWNGVDTFTFKANDGVEDSGIATVTLTVDPVNDIVVGAISGNTSEAGATSTFSVVLDTAPTADVTIGLSSSDTTEGTVAPASLTFTSSNWDTPQTVTVTGVDDSINDGNISFNIVTAPAVSADPSYSGMDPSDVSVTNTDNDTAGITVSAISGNTTEAGGTATFTVVLDAEPTADVSIGLSSADATEGSVSPATIVFTSANWDTPQTVTVTGVDDSIDDGNVGYSVVTAAASSTDTSYNNMNPDDVSVINEDDDSSSATVSPISGNTTEGGGTATFTIVLTSQPTQDVVIPLSSTDATEGTVSPASLTFTSSNWNSPQTVTATGVDDFLDDGDIPYSVAIEPAASSDPNYDGLDLADHNLVNQDDDTAAVVVGPISSNTTEAGGTTTFTMVLASKPSANVNIALSSTDTSEGVVSPTTVTFTSANWSAAQTITITGQDDAVDDGNVSYDIQSTASSTDASYNAIAVANVTLVNTDDDTAGITVSTIGGNTTEGGGTATFTVVLDTEPTANVTIGLSSDDTTEGTVAPASLTFTTTNWNTAQTVTVTGVDDAIDDGIQAYSIVTAAASSSDANYNGVNPGNVSVTNTDDDTAGITVSTISGNTTEAGGTATFTVVLDTEPTANVTIGLSSDDTTEGTVAPASLTFTTTNWNTVQTVTATGVDDAIADGNQTYNIVTAVASSSDADYNGLAVSDATVLNEDDEITGSVSGSKSSTGGCVVGSSPIARLPLLLIVLGLILIRVRSISLGRLTVC